jgi:uncharacterized protein (UPF0276 family)
VSWFEALSENYMVPGGRPRYWLDTIRRDYPMALHGVSLSIGSIDPLDQGYLDDLKALVDREQPMWVCAATELAFACSGGGNRGDGLADLQSRPTSEGSSDGSVGRTCSGVRRVS